MKQHWNSIFTLMATWYPSYTSWNRRSFSTIWYSISWKSWRFMCEERFWNLRSFIWSYRSYY